MQNDEAKIYFQSLALTLSNRGLKWVVEQADSAIAVGNIVDKEVDTGQMKADALSGEYKVVGKKKREKMKSTVPYTETEKLSMLVQSALHASKEIGAMEEKIASFFKERNFSGIKFVSEDGRMEFDIDEDKSAANASWGKVISGLFEKVRGEL